MKRIFLTLALVALSVCASAALHKSIMGAKKTFESGVAPAAWENPYITDGLVAMWDGEWNVEGGVHDPNATRWVNLIGEVVNVYPFFAANLPSGWQINNNSMYVNGSYTLTASSKIKMVSCEVVFCGEDNLTQKNKGFFNFVGSGHTTGYLGLTLNSDLSLIGNLSGRYRIDGTKTNQVSFGIADGNSSSYFFINGNRASSIGGAFNWGSGLGLGISRRTDYPFTGYIYCIRVYNRALTEEEILLNYSIDKERFGI